jgi:hypothetical protein
VKNFRGGKKYVDAKLLALRFCCLYSVAAELDVLTFPLLDFLVRPLKMLGRCNCVGNYLRGSRSIYSLSRHVTSHNTGIRHTIPIQER